MGEARARELRGLAEVLDRALVIVAAREVVRELGGDLERGARIALLERLADALVHRLTARGGQRLVERLR